MKKLQTAFIALVLLTFAACKKDLGACKKTEEITESSSHLVDPSATGAAELIDTLNKYPQLQLRKFAPMPSGWYADCAVFYKGLRVFSDNYRLMKTVATNSTVSISTTDTTLLGPVADISLTPAISKEAATAEAKHYVNLDHACIKAQLGIYNMGYAVSPRKYILVWKIYGDKEGPYAIIDANTNNMISYFGDIYIWID